MAYIIFSHYLAHINKHWTNNNIISLVLFILKIMFVTEINEFFQDHMSHVVRKPVFGVSDQVRHKPGCTVTEDG